MATLHQLHTQRLVSLAKTFQIRRAGDAAGRCLSVSLDFALAASQRFGVELQLVKWRVVGDPDYLDHWAVLLDDTLVLDPTHVQVDGSARLTRPLADYPAHFTRPRIYPAALLLAGYPAPAARDSMRLSNAFMWDCGTRLLRFDLGAAWARRDARAAGLALREAGSFLRCFALSSLTQALEARTRTLLERLKQQPRLPSRAGHSPAPSGIDSPTARAAVSTRGLAWANVAFSPATVASFSSACSVLLAHAA